MPWQTFVKVAVILVACMFSGPTEIFGQAENDITRFAQGLRARRLFDLAESYCRDGLANRELDPTTQTSLTLELIRTQSARAAISSGSKRKQSWAEAKQTAEDFLSANPNHPRKLLVQVQSALTYLAHGRLLRQEIEAEIAPTSVRDQALSELRTANSLFEDIQRTIRRLLPELRGRTPADHELSADQLTALNNNMRFQAAVCGINRAQLYPADDQLNRIDALFTGLEKLNAVRRETNSEQPLWWNTELQRAKCHRLLGNLGEAQQVLAMLPLKEANLKTKQAIVEQQIKVLIASRNLRNGPQIISEVEQIDNRSPELDLAIVELMMRLADAVDRSWRDKASQQLSQIESRHGAYWGRRAELLVIGTAGVINSASSTNNNDAGSPELLIRIGEQAARKNRLDDALKAFGQAIETANAQENWPLVFSTTVKQARILQQQSKHTDAGNQLINLAMRFIKFENASAAHLLGCWNLSRAINSDPELAAERKQRYAGLLDQHLTTWPEEKPADQARVWSARLHHHEKRWEQALDRYLSVQPNSKFFPQAIQQSVSCAEQWIEASNPNGADAALQYTQRLKGFLDAADMPQTGREQVLLGLAQIGLVRGIIESDELASQLEMAATGASEDSKLTLLSWLLVASASAGESKEELETTFLQISDNESALFKSLIGINSILAENPQASKEVIDTKLMISKMALALNLNDSKRTQWMGEWADALTRLGRHDEAIEALTELAKRKPKSAAAQMQLARGLSRIGTSESDERALLQWRRVAAQLKPQSENWFEAKYNVALYLHKTGKKSDALKLLEFLKVIPPGWSKSKWKNDFDQLLIKCQNP